MCQGHGYDLWTFDYEQPVSVTTLSVTQLRFGHVRKHLYALIVDVGDVKHFLSGQFFVEVGTFKGLRAFKVFEPFIGGGCRCMR